MNNLRLIEVRKEFDGVTVLHEVSLDVEAGEFMILVGPSGCGKSTLLNMIAGLGSVTSGRILINGEDVTKTHCSDRDIAMVFQNYALYPSMTVRQNIAFGLEMRKVPKSERETIVERVARTLEIEQLLDRKPNRLSGGQRQRVAMGRALGRDPTLFLFDEPLSNLDAKLRVEMRAEIRRMHKRTKTTTIYVTHDQVEAMTLGDRIAVMNAGRIMQLGTPEEVYTNPRNLYVAQFIGTPAINSIPAELSGDRIVAGGVEIPVKGEDLAKLKKSAIRDVFCCVRPEAVRLSDAGIPGVVETAEPTGPDTFLTVNTEAGPFTVRIDGDFGTRDNEEVRLDWDAQCSFIFRADSEERV